MQISRHLKIPCKVLTIDQSVLINTSICFDTYVNTGVRFSAPSLHKPHKPSPKNKSTVTKSNRSTEKNLAIAVLPGSGDSGEGSARETRGVVSARGVAGEVTSGMLPTPTGALASAMNRALRLKGPNVGPASPINKAASKLTPTGTRGGEVARNCREADQSITMLAAGLNSQDGRAGAPGQGDVYRYLGDAAEIGRAHV